MILLIDNYDSFTFNLVQRFAEIDHTLAIHVVRNDQITLEQADSLKPERLVISPGPCTPAEGGISNDLILHFAGRIPVLGVCLGHQCIAHSFGMTVNRADRLMHGKTSDIHHDGQGVYKGLPNPFTATRYHSLIMREPTLHPDFIISSWTDQREVMGLRHKNWPLEGVQFHPESFLTHAGHQLLANFLRL